MVLEPELLDPESGWSKIPGEQPERWFCDDNARVLAWFKKHDINIDTLFEADSQGVSVLLFCPHNQWDLYTLIVHEVNAEVRYTLITVPDIIGKAVPVEMFGIFFENPQQFDAAMQRLVDHIHRIVKLNIEVFGKDIPALILGRFRNLIAFSDSTTMAEEFIVSQRSLVYNATVPPFSAN